MELAARLTDEWGLRTDVPASGWDDLLGPEYTGDLYGDLAALAGLELPQPEQPSYPGIAELRQQLGL